jgi:hypothetical protein
VVWRRLRHVLDPDGWGRHLHATHERELPDELAIPAELEGAVERALALPTEERLRALARELAPEAPRDLEPPDAIRIDVFARRHDPETLAPSGVLLRSVELRLGDAPPAP